MDGVGQSCRRSDREGSIRMAKAELYESQESLIKETPVTITTYKIGERFFCHVENKDPGATIARAEGDTREQALETAVAKATARL